MCAFSYYVHLWRVNCFDIINVVTIHPSEMDIIKPLHHDKAAHMMGKVKRWQSIALIIIIKTIGKK